ncbi:TPA: hypothetical protein DDZ86_00375 [Candidatus Dependentiae bacterium]|nr:MAG: hypothetical protein UW09_C0002G0047 [candidate division TM6 bacterium GW2011_GWF2_43_87]HBL98084.1 hypothetical protein [Candidatus Dependentiae bacterium]
MNKIMTKKIEKIQHHKARIFLVLIITLLGVPSIHASKEKIVKKSLSKELKIRETFKEFSEKKFTHRDKFYSKDLINRHDKKNGYTPLIYACKAAKVNAAMDLIKNGANPSIPDAKGNTPLHTTTNNRITKLLLEHNANILAKNNSGQTPLARASLYKLWALHEKGARLNTTQLPGSLQIRALIDSCSEPTIFHTLLKSTSPMKLHTEFTTPYTKKDFLNKHKLLENNSAVLMRYLTHEHINLLTPDNQGDTPLHLLAIYKSGVPLIFKARFHQIKKVEIPLEPLSIKNKIGISPLDFAATPMPKANPYKNMQLLEYLDRKQSQSSSTKKPYCILFFGPGKPEDPSDLLHALYQQPSVLITNKSQLVYALNEEQKTKTVIPHLPLEDIHCKELSTNWILLIPDPEKKIKTIAPENISNTSTPTSLELELGLWVDHLASISPNAVNEYDKTEDPQNTTLTNELLDIQKNDRLFISNNFYKTTQQPEWITFVHGHSSGPFYQMSNKKLTFLPGLITLNSNPGYLQDFFKELCTRTSQKAIIYKTCYCEQLKELFSDLPVLKIFCSYGNVKGKTISVPLFSKFFETLSSEIKQKKPQFERALKYLYTMPHFSNPLQTPLISVPNLTNNVPLIQYPGKKSQLLSQGPCIESSPKKSLRITYTPHPLKLCPNVITLSCKDITHTLKLVEKKIVKKECEALSYQKTESLQNFPLIIPFISGSAAFTIKGIKAPSCTLLDCIKSLMFSWHEHEDYKGLQCENMTLLDDLFKKKNAQTLKLKHFSLYLVNKTAELTFFNKPLVPQKTRALVVYKNKIAAEFELQDHEISREKLTKKEEIKKELQAFKDALSYIN